MRRPLKFLLLGLAGLPLLAVISTHVASAVLVARQVTPEVERKAAEAKAYEGRVLADLQAVREDPFFAAARPAADAGELLHRILPWSGGGSDEKVLPEGLSLSPSEREQVRALAGC